MKIYKPSLFDALVVLFFVYMLVGILGQGQGLPKGALGLSGTVYAPAGEDIAGTVVVACYVEGEDCEEAKSQFIEITESGESAAFNFTGLGRETYMLFATKDVNANNTHFENGDFYALYGTDGNVTPPAPGLELRLTVLGAAPSTTTPSSETQLNTVTGIVLDTQGRPIEGAKVWIEPALTTGLVEVRTGANGRYSATSLIDVPYYAKAWTQVQYNGQDFCLRLGMPNASDYDSFVPTHGTERNFQWQLTGVIEDLKEYDEFFGGMVRVMSTGYYMDSADAIEFTFTPTGPRIDGSAGETIVRELDLQTESSDLYDIPVAPYRVTAVLIGNDGSRAPLMIGPDIFDNEHPEMSIDWASDGTCSNGNGVDWNYIWLDDPTE
jgi:hypothetical protein